MSADFGGMSFIGVLIDWNVGTITKMKTIRWRSAYGDPASYIAHLDFGLSTPNDNPPQSDSPRSDQIV
jgi:hypothetical protein